MTEPSANDLLMGGGGMKGVSWSDSGPNGGYVTKPYGTSYTGTIDGELTTSQQTDFVTGALQTWPDGKPKMQVFVPLQTQERDPQDSDDDGRRMLVIKQSSALQATIRDAVQAAGAKALEQGGQITVTLTGEQPSSKGNPMKTFSAQYVPPAQSTIMGAQSAQIAQNVAPQQSPAVAAGAAPVQAAPAPATPSQQDPFTLGRKLRYELNMAPEAVAAATGLTVDQVNQLPPF